MPQYPAVIELSSLAGSDGFQINLQAGGYGSDVSSAGDVNGDGFADIIIGASGFDANGYFSGASYVVFGKASGFSGTLNLAGLDGTDGFQINGETPYSYSGISVSGGGDINGDGFDDLIIGASGTGTNGYLSGSAYVVYGKGTAFNPNLNLSALNGVTGFQINGISDHDYAGRSVSNAGDINGDGFDDMLVGASGDDPGGPYSGASYIIFGKAGSFGASIELADLDGTNGFRINGEAEDDHSGRSVAVVGDINGDGFDDLLIGAPDADANGSYSGASYVLFGKGTAFAASVNLSALNGTTGFQINGEGPGQYSGYDVSGAGDFNGDGFADLIVSAPLADVNGSNSGASYIIFGKGTTFTANFNLSSLNGNNGFQINGEFVDDQSGHTVSAAGDVNGDGFDDVIIGTNFGDPNGGQSGASYVVFGKASGFTAEFSLANLDGTNGFQINGEAAFDRSGVVVSGAGDINNDGFDDLIISSFGTDPNGASHVVLGRKPDTAVTRTGTAADQTLAGGDFRDKLSALAGDDRLFGNGGNDVLNGGTGDDSIFAGIGSDTVIGGKGADTMDGGTGNDTLNYAASVAAVSINLQTNVASGGDAAGDQISGFERVVGSDFDDILVGGTGVNTLSGGLGSDTLTGGNGKDIFDFNAIADSTFAPAGRDTITDFNENAQDRIDLRTIDAIAGGANDGFSFIASAAFTALGQVRVFQAGGDTFVEMNTTGTTAADMRILLTGLHTLDGADFFL